jgi:hypothetical protein
MARIVSSSEKLFIGGDRNGHVGTIRRGFRGYMEVLDMMNRTNREKKILNFVVPYDLMIANTFFRKKKKSHLSTFQQWLTLELGRFYPY